MMSERHVIAVDLGAESGRVIQVGFDGKDFSLKEAHRFVNAPATVRGVLYWDALRLWNDITEGIKAVQQDAASVGVDTWGVDFALLDRDGNLLCNPVHYRDARKEGSMEWVFERVPRRTIFERTGIQFMVINGLFQFASMVRDNSAILNSIGTALTMGDLFTYWLSGSRTSEFTLATTTQCYNPIAKNWDYETLAAIGIPTGIFPQIVPTGTRVGEYNGIPVVATACHDTGSAVVAVPTTTDNFAYISSGTWSLIGLEIPAPVINDASYEANITNEGGVGGTFRMLKNQMGLWLAQQSRATWRDQGTKYSYDELAQMATTAQPFVSFIDPDDPSFLRPGDMPARIREFCVKTGQKAPESHAQVMRTIYESLALKYRHILGHLISLTDRKVDRMHIIGGGSQNRVLCQMTADAIGRPVVAGPVEATAMGNAIVQMIALGELASVAQAREILSRAAETVIYEPKNTAAWDEAYDRFKSIVGKLGTFN
ncbi:MAG: rhamnulokinase family protein [Anaerolineae bacterium]